MARVVVDVMLKSEILDSQGEAVANALPRLGVKGVNSVRIGKRIELEFDDNAIDIEQKAAKIADELLANPVIENFEVTVSPNESAAVSAVNVSNASNSSEAGDA